MKYDFRVGDVVKVVRPHSSLGAKVGDTAVITAVDTVANELDLEWLCERGDRCYMCYAHQFEPAGGPW